MSGERLHEAASRKRAEAVEWRAWSGQQDAADRRDLGGFLADEMDSTADLVEMVADLMDESGNVRAELARRRTEDPTAEATAVNLARLLERRGEARELKRQGLTVRAIARRMDAYFAPGTLDESRHREVRRWLQDKKSGHDVSGHETSG